MRGFVMSHAGAHNAKKPELLIDLAIAAEFQRELHDLAIDEFDQY
jgi:hypothetical protein